MTSLEIGDRQKRNSVKRYNINRKIAYSKKVRNKVIYYTSIPNWYISLLEKGNIYE